MATQMLQRRGTAAEWAAANEVLGEGALGLEEDTDVIKMGDGVTPWNDLANDRVYIPLSQQDARYVARDLVDAAGDILVATGDKNLTRLPRGAVGSRLTIQPDLTLAWVDLPPAANPFTGVDAAGDLLVGSAPDTVARLPVGANGKVLGVVGGLPAWMTPAAADLSGVVAKAGDTMTGSLTSPSLTAKQAASAQRTTMDNSSIEIGDQRAANGIAYIDFHTTVGSDYDMRIMAGQNGTALNIQAAGGVLENGQRVYSPSNPPPVSGGVITQNIRGSAAGANSGASVTIPSVNWAKAMLTSTGSNAAGTLGGVRFEVINATTMYAYGYTGGGTSTGGYQIVEWSA